jgi:hypothetical protein
VERAAACAAAEELGAALLALGGTGGGIIGALAGAILAAGGDDGRFVEIGRVRELTGEVTVAALLAAGIQEVRSSDGETATAALVDTLGGRVRPQLRGGRAVLLVERARGGWRVVEQGRHRPRSERRCSG